MISAVNPLTKFPDYAKEGSPIRRRIGSATCAARFPRSVPHLRFTLRYLRPDQKFADTLFMTATAGSATINIIYDGLLLLVLSIMIKTIASSKRPAQLMCKNYTLFMTKYCVRKLYLKQFNSF